VPEDIVDFGLFYFADYSPAGGDRYRLLTEGARFADSHGFASVWTPERHFHQFGGQYPNPAVTSAALAMVTNRVAIRAGSVVAPLHHAVRIAEEWSVVDNLSGGRVGISFAPGWHQVDFVLAPGTFQRRRTTLTETVDVVRRLWRQELVEFDDGAGERVKVRVFPAPVQPELPVWLTSSGSAETFRQAAELGAGVLTHLLGQDLDDLATKIDQYRAGITRIHHRPGHVVLMLHTFLGPDRDAVRRVVRQPFSDYLRSSVGLWARAANPTAGELAADDLDFLVERAFERHFESGGLFGTVADGMRMLEAVSAVGVDEVACLIDFIPDTDVALDGLRHLDALRRRWSERPRV
jgi:natural product biosynthesis luciferase-like monooxygenase protein